MKDCNDCSGSGKVPSDPYREAPMKPKDPVQPKIKVKRDWTKYKDFASNNYGYVIVLFFVLVLAKGCQLLIHDSNVRQDEINRIKKEADDKEQSRKDKEGFVIVQYNDKSEAIRCWIAHERTEIAITDHVAHRYLTDRKQFIFDANVLGVKDPDKECMR
jgi:hypothetical protein